MSHKNSVTVDEVVDFLNDCNQRDPYTVATLVRTRWYCAKTLGSEHPSIQPGYDEPYDTIGLVGILNGLFGVKDDGSGVIYVQTTDHGLIDHFGKT